MKERPILFGTPMVRAILDGRKTQTRRIAKICKDPDFGCELTPGELSRLDQEVIERACPHGRIGDRLWVRETSGDICRVTVYRADSETIGGEECPRPERWIPSIYMRRQASRITLEITNVRIERLQDITDEDAKAEGLIGPHHLSSEWSDGIGGWFQSPRQAFRRLWDSINRGNRAWDADLWVWVIEFKRVQCDPA